MGADQTLLGAEKNFWAQSKNFWVQSQHFWVQRKTFGHRTKTFGCRANTFGRREKHLGAERRVQAKATFTLHSAEKSYLCSSTLHLVLCIFQNHLECCLMVLTGSSHNWLFVFQKGQLCKIPAPHLALLAGSVVAEEQQICCHCFPVKSTCHQLRCNNCSETKV